MTAQNKNNPRPGGNNTSFPDPTKSVSRQSKRSGPKKPPALESMTREEIRQMFHEMQVKQLEAELENEQLRAGLEEYTNYAALFTKITENMLDLVILTDPSGNLKFIGESIKNLGYDSKSMIGHNITDFVHPDDLNPVLEKYVDVVAGGIPHRIRFRCRRGDGSYLWVEARGTSLKDEKGNPQEIVLNLRDITQQKSTEEALRKSEEKYRRIAENITDVVWTTDLNLNPTFVSSSIRKLMGESPEKHMQRTMAEKYPPAYLDKIYQILAEELEKENDPAIDNSRSRLIEVEHYKADGSTIWISMNISAIRDDNGNLTGLQGVTRDITDRKKSEQAKEKLQSQLNQAQKMESVGRLAGGVAHDFNNKLTIINGYAEMAIDMMDPPVPLHETIQEIHTAGKQSAAIVRQLLAFARKQEISPVKLDLNDTISGLLKMLQRLIGENIDLAWHPGKNLWSVKIDPSQLDQIMANLAVNASDAIADVGKITIKTNTIEVDEDYCTLYPYFVPGQYVILTVSDDGSGMDKETLGNIFEPFFTTKDVGKGTGLGLATVYGIVKQNKGFINVYSEPGMGTTFRIYLPRHEAEEYSVKPEMELKRQVPKGTETILIVEDEKGVLQMSRRILDRLGYTVLIAENPREALQQAKKYNETIHLLITDVVMPEMNGHDMSSQMTMIRPGLKTLYMSGYTANAIAHNGEIDMDVLFIQKPFSMQDFAVKVREAIEQE